MKLKTRAYRKPASALDDFAVQKAATLHQRANPADPFAFGRIVLHMRQGYDLPSDVIASATARLERRGQDSGYLE